MHSGFGFPWSVHFMPKLKLVLSHQLYMITVDSSKMRGFAISIGFKSNKQYSRKRPYFPEFNVLTAFVPLICEWFVPDRI